MAAKNKHKSFSAMMQWQQQGPQHFTLRLFGPLNGGTVLIEKRGTHLTYQDGQRTLQSNHPEQLILTETGVKIPINHLYYWLRGIKAPQPVHAQQFNAQGQLIGFEQGGFTLKFTAYTQVDNRLLPSKIDISHPEGGVKIVIKHWDLD
jgi:outer membrane lipoprotein LolB